MNQVYNSTQSKTKMWYLPFLMFLSGMGGLLAGIDFGIIAGALLYLDKTIPMTAAQQGFMVAIYTLGGVCASLFAGAFADLLGRKKMMLVGGVMFVTSILIIFMSGTYYPLLIGRILMGLSGGVICVVVPLFMAECLPTEYRGRGTSAFQLLLTLGLVLALVISKHFTSVHDKAVELAAGNTDLIFKADQDAWKHIFLTACVPGALFILLAIVAKESPRWLFRRNRVEEAATILAFTRTSEEVNLEIHEMEERQQAQSGANGDKADQGTVFQRKYMVPFFLSCVILACTQATGVNTILPFGVKILTGAGLSGTVANNNFIFVTITNCVVTFFGAMLVDKLGRKILLSIGTAGIIVSLISAGIMFNQFESKRVNVLEQVQAKVSETGDSMSIEINDQLAKLEEGAPGQLSVSYQYQEESKPSVVVGFSNAEKPEERVLKISPPSEVKWETVDGKKVEVTHVKNVGKLTIKSASYGPIPSEKTGMIITVLLCCFIASFAFGPGVCVWLALTELMPTRIRSTGMGVAMVLNNGVAFISSLVFPTVIGSQGYHLMFFIWAGFTVIYFITSTFFLVETKGKTLEEIEDHYAGKGHAK